MWKMLDIDISKNSVISQLVQIKIYKGDFPIFLFKNFFIMKVKMKDGKVVSFNGKTGSQNKKSDITEKNVSEENIILKETENIKVKNFKEDTDIEKISLKGKKILMRVDFNIPLKPLDLSKIDLIIPTLEYLLGEVYSITLISHFKRPSPIFNLKGEHIKLGKSADYKHFSLKNVYEHITREREIFKNLKFNKLEEGGKFFSEKKYHKSTKNTENFELLENTRLYNLNEEDMKKFCKKGKYDLLVFDAFSAIHRKFDELKILPSIYGNSVIEGIEFTKSLLEKNFDLLFIGGNKPDKLDYLEYLIKSDSKCYVSGRLAVDLELSSVKNPNIHLPVDYILNENNHSFCIEKKEVTKDNQFKIKDIGNKTIRKFAEESYRNRIVFVNGLPGIYEDIEFCKGTVGLFTILDGMISEGSEIFVFGGDTNGALDYYMNKIDLSSLKDSKKLYRNTSGGAVMAIIKRTKEVDENLKLLKITEFK